jgi:hypothetical protein
MESSEQMKVSTLRRACCRIGVAHINNSSKYRGEMISQKWGEQKVIKRYMKNDERRVIRNQDGYLEHVIDMNRERSIEQNQEATGESLSPQREEWWCSDEPCFVRERKK